MGRQRPVRWAEQGSLFPPLAGAQTDPERPRSPLKFTLSARGTARIQIQITDTPNVVLFQLPSRCFSKRLHARKTRVHLLTSVCSLWSVTPFNSAYCGPARTEVTGGVCGRGSVPLSHRVLSAQPGARGSSGLMDEALTLPRPLSLIGGFKVNLKKLAMVQQVEHQMPT